MARVAKIRLACCAILNAHGDKDTATTVAALVKEFGWTESNARNAIRWNAANSGTPLPTDWTVGRKAKVKPDADEAKATPTTDSAEPALSDLTEESPAEFLAVMEAATKSESSESGMVPA
jgi:hypothetical protein